MAENRIFTDEELKALGARTLDLILSALESGDTKAAGGLSKRMVAEFQGIHDLYRDWVTHLLSIIGRKYGDEALSEALHETVAGYTRRLAGAYAGKDVKARVETLCAGLRGHLKAFEVSEDDEAVNITAPVCGSGGRLAASGAYDGPDGFLKVKNPQEMTFNRADFPVYCAHCYFQNIVPAGEDGAPLFVTEPTETIGKGACKVTIAK